MNYFAISVVFGDLVFKMACNVSGLPHILGRGDVDRIICDVPFGVNHSCVSDVKELYPQLIRAIDRCVVVMVQIGVPKKSLIKCALGNLY